MAWRWPRRIPKSGAVLDEFDFQDAIQPVVEELAGALDEHNFSADLSGELTQNDYDDDVPWRYATASHLAADDLWGLRAVATADAAVDAIQAPYSTSWRAVEGLDAVEIDLRETTPVHMVGGCEFWWDWTGIGDPSIEMTVRWALRIDGSVYADAINGSQDYLNEGKLREMGYAGTCHAIMVESLINLTPGLHTIELVYQTDEPKAEIGYAATRPAFLMIGSYELVAIGLER